MTTIKGERITVRWAGGTHDVAVLKRFKNGKITVRVQAGRWLGGRAGTTSSDVIVTVEPWQVLNFGPEDTEGSA